MKRSGFLCFVLVLCMLFSFFGNSIRAKAQEEGEPSFSLYAKSAVLMDADSGRVLYEKDGYTHLPNASTTKILTCILAIESGRLEEAACVSTYAASMPKVRLGMTAGDHFLVKDLLYSLMLESHNDAAVAVAEHIGGSVEGFAAMMNEKAAEIGCTDTYFITPNGLDASDENGVHGTTARDLALIMSYCLQNDTFLAITQTQTYTFANQEGTRSYSCYNHNAFLSMMEGALTGKTGFTGNAGYCYVGALRQGERTFVVALLACGWPNNKNYKWSDTKKLMEYALENYQYEDVYEDDMELSDILVEQARPSSWKLYQQTWVQPQVSRKVLRVLKRPEEEIQIVCEIPKTIQAPVAAGQQVGWIRYFLGEQELASYPVTLGEQVEEIKGSWYLAYIVRKFMMIV